MRAVKVVSLFDGIAAGRVALNRAGFNVSHYYSSEIDPYANKIALKNYPDIIPIGDVFDIDYSQFSDIDFVIGGSPCTHWSIAKANRETTPDGLGFKLFEQFVRGVKELKPKFFLYENNYSIHKNIKNAISEALGVEPVVINSSLVSGQSRKRCYWTNIPNISQPVDRGIYLEDVLESGSVNRDKSYCITANEHKGSNLETYLTKSKRQLVFETIRIGDIGSKSQGSRVYSVKGKSVTLSANGGGHGAKTGLYKIDLPDGDYVIRKLTPTECELLQTFPVDYTEGISNTQRYKCIGNSWTVDIISHILKHSKYAFEEVIL